MLNFYILHRQFRHQIDGSATLKLLLNLRSKMQKFRIFKLNCQLKFRNLGTL